MENFSLLQTHFNNDSTAKLGERGEDLAYQFLINQNYRIVCTNFKTPVGRNRRGAIVTGEIDLIAYSAEVLCFVEVKTRSSDEFASPLAAVDLRKQRQIIRAARMYRKIFHLRELPFRYDVVSIVLKKNESPKIELFQHYFSENKFEKKTWFPN